MLRKEGGLRGRITDRGCRSSENYNYVVLPLAIGLAMVAQKLGDVTSHSVSRNHPALLVIRRRN